jgi:hypothetical protein
VLREDWTEIYTRTRMTIGEVADSGTQRRLDVLLRRWEAVNALQSN